MGWPVLARYTKLIVVNDIVHGRIIAREAETVFNPELDQCISRVENGKLLGGVTFTGYTGASIHMHAAVFSPKFGSRHTLQAIFYYPFIQLQCGTVFGQVPETNKKALEIDLRLGFKIVAKIEDVFPDGACYVLAMPREDCRWIRQISNANRKFDGVKNGFKSQSPAAP